MLSITTTRAWSRARRYRSARAGYHSRAKASSSARSSSSSATWSACRPATVHRSERGAQGPARPEAPLPPRGRQGGAGQALEGRGVEDEEVVGHRGSPPGGTIYGMKDKVQGTKGAGPGLSFAPPPGALDGAAQPP